MMVDIMQECWKGMLVDIPEATGTDPKDMHDIALPSPQELRKKILIKVKYSPPKPPVAETPEPKQVAKPATSSSSSSDEETDTKKKKVVKTKIIEGLSKLGFYTRSVHFKSFDQPGTLAKASVTS